MQFEQSAAPAPSAPFRPPSNYHNRDTLLFSASLPQDCRIEGRVKSCSYFTVKPLRGATLPARRCLVSLSLSFIPSTRALISDFKLELDFAKHLWPAPTILGFRFMSLEDTTFEADFAEALKASPTVLGSAWHDKFYEHLLVGPGDLKRKIGQKFTHSCGERRDPAHLIIRGDGFTGGHIGTTQTLPVCVLLEVPSALPESLVADCTLSCRVIDLTRAEPDGGPAATTTRQQILDVRLAHGPELAVCQEDSAYYLPMGEREHAARIEAPASKNLRRRMQDRAVRFMTCLQDPSQPESVSDGRPIKASNAPRAAAARSAISNTRQRTDTATQDVTILASVQAPQVAPSPITAIPAQPLNAVPDSVQPVRRVALRRPGSPIPMPLPEGYRMKNLSELYKGEREAVASYMAASNGNGGGKSGPIRLYHCMRNDWALNDLKPYGITWDDIATYLDRVYAMTGVTEDRGRRYFREESLRTQSFKGGSLQRRDYRVWSSETERKASKSGIINPPKTTKSTSTSPTQPTSAEVSSDSKQEGSTSGPTREEKGKWVSHKKRASIPNFARPLHDPNENLVPEVLATPDAVPLKHHKPTSASSLEPQACQNPVAGVHAEGYRELLAGLFPAPASSDSSTRSLYVAAVVRSVVANTDSSWSVTPAQER